MSPSASSKHTLACCQSLSRRPFVRAPTIMSAAAGAEDGAKRQRVDGPTRLQLPQHPGQDVAKMARSQSLERLGFRAGAASPSPSPPPGGATIESLVSEARFITDDVCPAGTRQWYICFIVCFCLPAGAPRPPPGHGGL